MSNYSNTYGGAAKDAAQDIILGADIDSQLDDVANASGTKANKITSPNLDNILTMDNAGDLKDSGKAITDKADVAGDTYTGVIDQNDTTESTSGSTGSIHSDGGIGAIKSFVTDALFKPLGDVAAGLKAAFGYTAAKGAILTGQGSENDVTIMNDAKQDVMGVPTGTRNQKVSGIVYPVADGTLDLGKTALRFKDIFADAITITGGILGSQMANNTVDTAQIAADAVGTAEIANSTTTAAGSISAGSTQVFALNDWALFPMIHAEAVGPGQCLMAPHNTDGSSAASPRFSIHNGHGSSARTYDVDHRYIIAA